MEEKKYVALFLDYDSKGEIIVKKSSKDYESAVKALLNKPGIFGDYFEISSSKKDADGNETKRKYSNSILKKYEEDFRKYHAEIAQDNRGIVNSDVVEGENTRENQNSDNANKAERTADDEAVTSNEPAYTCPDNTEECNKTDQAVSETAINGEESTIKGAIAESASQDIKNPFSSDKKDNFGYTEYKIGQLVQVGFLFYNEDKKKRREIRQIQFSKEISKEEKDEKIWVYPQEHSKQDITYELDENKKDGRSHVYKSLEEGLRALGVSNNSQGETTRATQATGTEKVRVQEPAISVAALNKLREKLDTLARKIDSVESSVKSASHDSLRIANQNAKEYFASEGRRIGEKLARIDEQLQDVPSKKKLDNAVGEVVETIEPIGSDIQEAKSSLETLQGKISSLEEVLSKKGISIQRETVPTNNDAVVIANAKRLAVRLIDDIAEAAMAYAYNRDIIENADENEEKRNKEFIARIETAKDEAKSEAFEEMLSAYADMTSFFAASDNEVAVAVLKKYGIVPDVLFAKDAEIVLSDEDIEKCHSKASGLDKAGKYKVIIPAYMSKDKVIQSAKCKLIAVESQANNDAECANGEELNKDTTDISQSIENVTPDSTNETEQ